MGHRPYPNAKRSRWYVDARHGSSCPRCGHYASVHPYKNGQFVCSRTLNGLPSCRECAGRLMALANSPLRGLAATAAQIQVTLSSITMPSADTALGRRSVLALANQAARRA